MSSPWDEALSTSLSLTLITSSGTLRRSASEGILIDRLLLAVSPALVGLDGDLGHCCPRTSMADLMNEQSWSLECLCEAYHGCCHFALG